MIPDGIRRLVAPNPGPLTGPGTNTWLIGRGPVAILDPGPADPAHLAAILGALGGTPVDAILVTHAHLDHSPLAPVLSERLGAPVLAFGDALAGRSPAMERLSGIGGGEGVDAAFAPDRSLADGEAFEAGGTRLTALHTPGHFGNHMCFAAEGSVFSGDLVMDWATTLVSPPDGEMAAFRTSCRRLAGLGPDVLLPGHGDPVARPRDRIGELLAHRDMREAQIEAALAQAPGTASELAERIYIEVPRTLLPAAARNVLAHLIDLAERGRARAPDGISEHARFEPA